MRETAFYKGKPTHTINNKFRAICFLVHAAVVVAENADTKKTCDFLLDSHSDATRTLSHLKITNLSLDKKHH